MTIAPFRNEKEINWKLPENREELMQELTRVTEEFSKQYPLIIDGEEIHTEDKIASINPSQHDQILGYMSQANQEHIQEAITGACKAFKSWGKTSSRERALYLLKAANVFRRRKTEFMAWLIYESGKNIVEAEGDVNEAIDFLEIYARHAIDLGNQKELISIPKVENRMLYIPLGVGVVIPPWNFPLAILTGLTTSAIVTGNTVLVKPAGVTPMIAAKFMEVMKEIDLPAGVINFVPGASREIGDFMVGHKDINFISFTGSKEAGVHIDEVAHRRIPKQRWIKRVISEMGGKDGIVVDETADIDLAADGIVTSAFGFQGQKCSAGSRAIIHEAIYDELVKKIIDRVKELTVGPAIENPDLGPVIDENAFNQINEYIEIGKQEATLAIGGSSDKSIGYFIQPTVFIDAHPHSRIMQEEIFGPVLAISKVSDYKEGIEVYNDTEYGLTGSFYSKKRDRIEYASLNMECGNLFINGKCTGAIVGVQPFGGYYMSGTGSKTGTVDFLMNFVQAKTISENL
ncbi:L-glutamate gamma-semialdehyde dehydrogenase [Bacillus sp. 1P02SD]|uniref:L-glutamate gamma-semialdehyde dehydrogenase n=1 Tax=Bacillus sp. 1P02SD TaxID=3132264 RepID=UPI0039A3C3F8